MKYSGPNYLARWARFVLRFIKTAFVQGSFGLLLMLVPILLVASPQRTGETPVDSAPTADGSHAVVKSFPPFPYQGSPSALPQDEGTLGLRLSLRQLATTARLMQTVAHPDDEDGGMLTLEARGSGASVLLMTLNRGEGGQNKVGSNLSDVLGVLRTL